MRKSNKKKILGSEITRNKQREKQKKEQSRDEAKEVKNKKD